MKTSLDDVPVVISGMASSTIGLRELPYKPLPFAADGSDLVAEILAPTVDFKHATLLISGVSSTDDVMRGEILERVYDWPMVVTRDPAVGAPALLPLRSRARASTAPRATLDGR